MFNKVILIGRLTRQPELTYTPNHKAVIRTTLAVRRNYKNKNGEYESDFISVVVWGKLAELMTQYAEKGSLVNVEGQIRTRSYEKDGQTRYVTEVLAENFTLLESRAQRAARHNAPQHETETGDNVFETMPPMTTNPLDITEDDLPF